MSVHVHTSYRLCEVQDDLARSAHDAAGLLLDLDDQIQSQHQALPGVSPQEPGGENNLVSLTIIKYRCAGQAQPTPNPLAKDQLRPKMGGGSPQTPLFTQGGQFCP